MHAPALLRLAALALVAAAPFGPLGHWTHPGGHTAALATTPAWVLAHTSVWLWALLTAFGLPGLYAHIAPRVGAWAVAAFGVMFVHLTNAIAAMQTEAVLVHSLAVREGTRDAAQAALDSAFGGPPIASLLAMGPMLLGPLLFGLALLRAGRPWRGPGAALMTSPLLVFALFASGNGFWAFRVGMVVGELALGWAGLVLWRELRPPRRERVAEPAIAA